MPLALSYPVRHTSRGLVDAFDATDKFPGACVSLANLIFDQSNPEVMVSRPGVADISTFAGFDTPTRVSCHITVGDYTYGLIGTNRNANKDEPFVYNHATGAFVTVAGVLDANTPTTQAASGAWTPPTIASVGIYVVVTHPGFPGGATKFGYFDITTLTSPSWTAGDTATNALTGTPVAVANFNNRAYFAYQNRLEYTDILSLTRSASTQALTIGDASFMTALSGLPVQTTSSGIVQTLTIFKAFQIWQVTGDASSSNLAQNYVSLTVGCSSPRSIAQSPLGLYFASINGPMIIDQFGVLRALTASAKDLEPDIQAAWQNATTPSRIAGGYSAGVYRLVMETTLLGETETNDYWFHEKRRRWTGPHTFGYASVSQFGNYFVIASNSYPRLIRSESFAMPSTVYTDLGSSFSCTQQSATFPKEHHMAMKQVIESTQELASAQGAATYNITALDDQENTLATASIAVLPAGTLWGSGVWGGFTWASAINRPAVYGVPWSQPLVFQKMAIQITATATTQVAMGTFFARWKDCGYQNRLPVP